MRAITLLLLVVPALVLAAEDVSGGDLDALQGTWRSVEVYRSNGQPIPPEQLDRNDATTTFQGDRMTNRLFNGTEYQQHTFRITIDPSRSPKEIDWWFREAEPPRMGIYELEGDTLKIAWEAGSDRTNDANQRPTELAPCRKGADGRWTYSVYRRVKPD